MSVKSLIDLVEPRASGYSRTSILTLIQQAQDELLDAASASMLYRDNGNKGFAPYLQTTAATYKYDIANANMSANMTRTLNGSSRSVRCRKVLSVYVDSTLDDYTRRFIGEEYAPGFTNTRTTSTDRMVFSKVPCESFPATEYDNAYVIFPFDPGTTTDVYFVDFTWEAPRLASESIPLCVPIEYERALKCFVIGEIQRDSNGKPNEFQDEFRRYWIPRFNTLMSNGAQTSINETPIRVN